MVDAARDVPLVCLSHLRWAFVFQRPQHLMVRSAAERRVFFVEEPVPGERTRMEVRREGERLWVAVPHLSKELWSGAGTTAQGHLLSELFEEHGIGRHIAWYYTPMALAFTRQLPAAAVVYDCMDELSAFAGAPPELRAREAELLQRAHLVLTGGYSLYEAKRHLHPNIHAFPSSVDVAHFARARRPTVEPDDQASIPRPRIGYAGVIDERMDLELLAGVADARPDWNLVMLGPVVKIEEGSLPRRPNIHWLGGKSYLELPS